MYSHNTCTLYLYIQVSIVQLYCVCYLVCPLPQDVPHTSTQNQQATCVYIYTWHLFSASSVTTSWFRSNLTKKERARGRGYVYTHCTIFMYTFMCVHVYAMFIGVANYMYTCYAYMYVHVYTMYTVVPVCMGGG